jgi:hypothetical protein
VHADFVHETLRQALLDDVGAAHDHTSASSSGATASASATARATPSVTNVNVVGPRTSFSPPRFVTTNTGSRKAPSSPHRPMPSTNMRRPSTTALAVACIRTSASRSGSVAGTPSSPIQRCRREPAEPTDAPRRLRAPRRSRPPKD